MATDMQLRPDEEQTPRRQRFYTSKDLVAGLKKAATGAYASLVGARKKAPPRIASVAAASAKKHTPMTREEPLPPTFHAQRAALASSDRKRPQDLTFPAHGTGGTYEDKPYIFSPQQRADAAAREAAAGGARTGGGVGTPGAGSGGASPGIMKEGNAYARAPAGYQGELVKSGPDLFVGARNDAEAVRQNPAAYGRVNSMGHGMGLTDMMTRLADQMRSNRLARRNEMERRRLTSQAMKVPDAQYYNMSNEGGALAAAQGRQQAAQELLKTTGQERIAGERTRAEMERSGRQEARQDRAYALQEGQIESRNDMAVAAARRDAQKAELKEREKRGELTPAGEAYVQGREDAALMLPKDEQTAENIERFAREKAATVASAAGMYLHPDEINRYITPEEAVAAARAAGFEVGTPEEAAAALGLIGGPGDADMPEEFYAIRRNVKAAKKKRGVRDAAAAKIASHIAAAVYNKRHPGAPLRNHKGKAK